MQNAWHLRIPRSIQSDPSTGFAVQLGPFEGPIVGLYCYELAAAFAPPPGTTRRLWIVSQPVGTSATEDDLREVGFNLALTRFGTYLPLRFERFWIVCDDDAYNGDFSMLVFRDLVGSPTR